MLSIDKNPVLLLSACQSDTCGCVTVRQKKKKKRKKMCRLFLKRNYMEEEEETDILPVKD